MTDRFVVDSSAARQLIVKTLDPAARRALPTGCGWSEAAAAEVLAQEAPIGWLTDWLGEPIEIDGEHAHQVERVRRSVFGGSAGSPTGHLGMTQTYWLLLREARFLGAIWLTADDEIIDFASRSGMPYLSVESWLTRS